MQNKKQKLALIPTIIISSLCLLPYAHSMTVDSIPSQCRGEALVNGIMNVSVVYDDYRLSDRYWMVQPSPIKTDRAADIFLENCRTFFPQLTKDELFSITLQFKSVIANKICSDTSNDCTSNSESEAIEMATVSASEKIDELLVQFLEI